MGRIKTEQKTRDGNFELLRIVSMLMIVTLHYLGKGKLIYSNEGSTTYYAAWILEALCYVAVNTYVLISGYYTKSTSFKLNKLLDLWIQTVIISVSAYFVSIRTGITDGFSWKSASVSFMPITSSAYWFITTYFVFLAIVPFLVYVSDKINKNQHKTLCLTLITLTSLLPTVFFNVDWLKINKGYDIIWFITLFFVASYIRKYDVFNKNPLLYFLGYLASCGVGLLLRFLIKAVFSPLTDKDISLVFFEKYNMFFTFAASVLLFLAFKNIHIKGVKTNKLICFFSSVTVYVYLIHEAPSIRNYLWKDFINPLGHLGIPDILINYVLGIGGVYLACSIIGKIIVEVYKLLRINKLTILINNKVSSAVRKIVNSNGNKETLTDNTQKIV